VCSQAPPWQSLSVMTAVASIATVRTCVELRLLSSACYCISVADMLKSTYRTVLVNRDNLLPIMPLSSVLLAPVHLVATAVRIS